MAWDLGFASYLLPKNPPFYLDLPFYANMRFFSPFIYLAVFFVQFRTDEREKKNYINFLEFSDLFSSDKKLSNMLLPNKDATIKFCNILSAMFI